MDVKQAVAAAKRHVVELFADEQISNVGLEEIEFDQSGSQWFVTIGFSRPWDNPQLLPSILAGSRPLERTYKVVCIDPDSGLATSVKNREFAK